MNYEKAIDEYCKYIKLPEFRKHYKSLAEEAYRDKLSYEQYLYQLLSKEEEKRKTNRITSQIRLANFPQKKYLEELDLDELPKEARMQFNELKSLTFIKEKRNLIMTGNPGTGKTHLAIGLGIEACRNGFKVLFTSIPSLVTQLKESRSEGVLRRMEAKFERYDLVICDEFGYISFDKEGAELLFSNLSLRAGRKSIIVTSNLSFDRWNEIFNDPVLTAAFIDRLSHKSHLIDMTGDSYRIKETKEWMQNSKV
jgi:DNA replication protein DnaC